MSRGPFRTQALYLTPVSTVFRPYFVEDCPLFGVRADERFNSGQYAQCPIPDVIRCDARTRHFNRALDASRSLEQRGASGESRQDNGTGADREGRDGCGDSRRLAEEWELGARPRDVAVGHDANELVASKSGDQRACRRRTDADDSHAESAPEV